MISFIMEWSMIKVYLLVKVASNLERKLITIILHFIERKYVHWTESDAKVVETYFSNFFKDVSSSGAKGSLPGVCNLRNVS